MIMFSFDYDDDSASHLEERKINGMFFLTMMMSSFDNDYVFF